MATSVACFCGHIFEAPRSTCCGRCGEPILLREEHETGLEFDERIAVHHRTEDDTRGLPESVG